MQVQKNHICGKDYIWNPTTRICKKGNLTNIMDHSVTTCDEIIDADEEANAIVSFLSHIEVIYL